MNFIIFLKIQTLKKVLFLKFITKEHRSIQNRLNRFLDLLKELTFKNVIFIDMNR